MSILTLLAAVLFLALAVFISLNVQKSMHLSRLSSIQLRQQELEKDIELAREETRLLRSDKENLLTQLAKAQSELGFLTEQYQLARRYQKENELLQQQLALFKAKFHAGEEMLIAQQREMEKLGERYHTEFRNLAQNILEEKSEKFVQVNEEKLNAILGPLKTQLGEFKQKVEDAYDKESKERFTLGKELQKLVEMSQMLGQEANNLTHALKGNNKMQGNWGEMILESLLENSGLQKGREYLVQEFIRDNSGNVIKDESGKALQPDIIIHYPDERKLIIDSKVSLLAWEQFVSSEDNGLRHNHLQEHIRSLRAHIEGLSRKNYPRYARALDYVLLFIPIEPAFLEAVKSDTGLWKYAYDKRILLVSPTTLFAVLKIVADLWKVEQQNRNAIEIADKAGALYDKFCGFVENLEILGRKIEEANQVFDTAFRQLSTGKGNLVNRVEELKKMGANAQKQIPERRLSA